jgi:hypothetical protein
MNYIVRYKKLCICFNIVTILFVVPNFSRAQDINLGSIKNLSAANGFGNIFLGENISLIPKSKLAFMDNDSIPDIDGCVKYEYRDLDRVKDNSNLDLDLVGIRIYKKKIINIYLFFKRDNGYQMFNSFEANYGNYTERVTDFTYNWESENVKLHLEYNKEDLGIAIYSSKKLYRELYQNKSNRFAAQ